MNYLIGLYYLQVQTYFSKHVKLVDVGVQVYM